MAGKKIFVKCETLGSFMKVILNLYPNFPGIAHKNERVENMQVHSFYFGLKHVGTWIKGEGWYIIPKDKK